MSTRLSDDDVAIFSGLPVSNTSACISLLLLRMLWYSLIFLFGQCAPLHLVALFQPRKIHSELLLGSHTASPSVRL